MTLPESSFALRTFRFSRALLVAAAIASPCLPAAAQHGNHPAAPTPPAATVPFYDGLGSATWKISTYRPDAQSYFDQGVRWMHAFNLEEAEAAFREALRRDPSCAMCAWGIASSLAPHINLPALPERTVAAAAAMRDAVRLAGAGTSAATPLERALIEAMARRSSDPAPTTPEAQTALDTAYADAMRSVARAHRGNAQVQFLLAEALMDLHPWDLYAPEDGKPRPWTTEIVATIEDGLRLDARHPGLHHLHIHAVEASKTPDRALASADFLRAAMPDAAHMVHMPGHIYQRVGRYGDAALANERAMAVDGSYLAKASPNVSFYKMLYAPHNVDFLASSTGMEGRGAATQLAIAGVMEMATPEMLRQMPGFDFLLGRSVWTNLRFGRHADVVAAPLPAEDFPFARAMFHTARALAFARAGRLDEALVEQKAMGEELGRTQGDAPQGLNTVAGLAVVAGALVGGEIAAAQGDLALAARRFDEAGRADDALRYNEPADWYFPARHWGGATLLAKGRNAEAEALFRVDLERNRENGWALTGLAAALERQGKAAEAKPIRERQIQAWRNADLGIEAIAAPAAGAAAAPAASR